MNDTDAILQVLRRHRWNSQRWRCLCGWEGKGHEAHQAEALSEDFAVRVAAARAELEGRIVAALAIQDAHLTALPPGFEDKCLCYGCEMARALRAAVAVPEPEEESHG